MIKKNSKEWAKVLRERGYIVLDPDGWDRKNYEYSWCTEEITWAEFMERASISTTISIHLGDKCDENSTNQ